MAVGNLRRNATVSKMAITATTAAVGFVAGWSTGGWVQGLGLAAALGAGGGIAAFSEKPNSRWSCRNWLRRQQGPGSAP